MITLFILIITCSIGVNGQDPDRKRTVLHSDPDIEKALQSLRREIDADLRREIDAKNQENNVLRAELADMRSIIEHAVDRKLLLDNDLDIEKAMQELRDENNALKNELTELRKGFIGHGVDRKRVLLHSDLDVQQAIQELTELRKGQGSSYVRWGRTVCSGNGTEKVYSGYTGGSPYSIEGGAASYICLPEHPSWAHYIDGIQNRGAHVYGTEYETYWSSTSESAFADSAFGKPMQNQDAPCVVCRSPRPVTIMIPGSTGCNAGWTLEYTGYLMTDGNTHKTASDYACVDNNPEAVLHGEADLNGKLLYFTEVQCGSLPCQEYPQGRELACAVCSK